jgi:hypothetical protein
LRSQKCLAVEELLPLAPFEPLVRSGTANSLPGLICLEVSRTLLGQLLLRVLLIILLSHLTLLVFSHVGSLGSMLVEERLLRILS